MEIWFCILSCMECNSIIEVIEISYCNLIYVSPLIDICNVAYLSFMNQTVFLIDFKKNMDMF